MNTEVEPIKKRFPCSYCDYSSDYKHVLIRHERLHTGDKPFKCKHCDKSFNQKGGLVNHVRLHTGEKPYSCNHCNKSFTTSSSLNMHKKKCNYFDMKEEPLTESYILNDSMYNPDDEVHHNVADATGNHQMRIFVRKQFILK